MQGMEINTTLTSIEDIEAKVRNSFSIEFVFFKSINGDPLDMTGYGFSMSIGIPGHQNNIYNFSLADQLSVFQNKVRLNITANIFNNEGGFSYDIRQTWPDQFTSVTILEGRFTIKRSLTPLPQLGQFSLPPVIKTITVIQPIFYEPNPVQSSYPYSYPLNY